MIAGSTTTDEPQDVIVSRAPDATKPWRRESRDIKDASDPRFRGRYQFGDCEAAWDDAIKRGHRPEVRE